MQIWADLEGHLTAQWNIIIIFFYKKKSEKKGPQFCQKLQKWNYFEVKTSAGTIPAKLCSWDSDSFGLCGKESDSMGIESGSDKPKILRKWIVAK
jgi:hypothetical protein